MRALLWLIPFLALFLSGCRTTPFGQKADNSESLWNYWQPYSLLASPHAHPRLEIEIDAVVGAEPTPADVRALQAFFETYCRKPGGVTVRIDPPIATDAAKDLTAQNLAGRYCDGPRQPDSAFAYFLFYDSRLAGVKSTEPFTTRTPYPGAVFIDQRYVRQWARWPGTSKAPGLMILHEAGHVLGLASNKSHGDGKHCANTHCLMNVHIYIRPFRILFPGPVIPQKAFCADCLRDLADLHKATPPANVRFHGLYVVRSEPLYHVISSPGFTYIHGAPLESLSFEWLDQRRRAVFQEKRPGKEAVFFLFEIPAGADFNSLLPALATDPVEFVRDLPKLIQEKLDAQKKEKPALPPE